MRAQDAALRRHLEIVPLHKVTPEALANPD